LSPKVIDVKAIDDYKLIIFFQNGEINMSPDTLYLEGLSLEKEPYPKRK
jgi:hypothetical protein